MSSISSPKIYHTSIPAATNQLTTQDEWSLSLLMLMMITGCFSLSCVTTGILDWYRWPLRMLSHQNSPKYVWHCLTIIGGVATEETTSATLTAWPSWSPTVAPWWKPSQSPFTWDSPSLGSWSINDHSSKLLGTLQQLGTTISSGQRNKKMLAKQILLV